MGLTNEIISQFAKITKDTKKTNSESTVFGTAVEYDGSMYVRIDGSDLLTPATTTAAIKPGERVTVMIKNHSATITGNITSPSANSSDVQGAVDASNEASDKITEFEILIADKVSTDEFDAQVGRIDTLYSDNVTIKQTLTTNSAIVKELEAEHATINGRLTANEASIESLKTTKLDAEIADITYATIEELTATNADIYNLEATYGDFQVLTTNKFNSIEAKIENLEVGNFDAVYANIDFSNIGKAAMEYFYANSGLIEDVVVNNGTITGNLAGVTIKGDLIEGNTIIADKLVIKGEDGLYYKLNTDGVTTESEQTEYNSINGNVILANSITASKINVADLVAFDATIGGFKITENSIYSGVKETVNNTTRGIYLDNDGQMAIGDSNNFIKYYKDTDGSYKLEISADNLSVSSGANLGTIVNEVEQTSTKVAELEEKVSAGGLDGEDATVLRIDSSRGTVFKNNAVSTVLTVTVYHGSKRITDIETLQAEYGAGAYLEWSWQRLNDESFGVILSTDSRISNGGFTFTLSPEDVDTKVVFMCQLITE